MAETKNPDAPIVAPRTPRFSEGSEGKAMHREHGQSSPGRIGQFLHDVRAEMKRVSWPSASHVQSTTIITLIAVVFFALYLWLVDLGFTQLVKGIEWLLQRIASFLGLG